MGRTVLESDLIRLSPNGDRIPVHITICFPELQANGTWMATTRFSTIDDTVHQCEGLDSLHAFLMAFQFITTTLKNHSSNGARWTHHNGEPFALNDVLEGIFHNADRLHVAVPVELLDRFHPSPDALLDVLCEQINAAMLREIAQADHFADAASHFRALRKIKETKTVPCPLEWEPREVLQLTQWSEPEEELAKPNSSRARHLMRAFSCAVLLRAAAQAECERDASVDNSTIIQAVESALVLDDEIIDATLSYLSWHVQRVLDNERPFFALGLLMLAFFKRRKVFRDEEIAILAKWVISEEARSRQIEPRDTDRPWSSNSRCMLKLAKWKSHASRLQSEAVMLDVPDVREIVDSIARGILEISTD